MSRRLLTQQTSDVTKFHYLVTVDVLAGQPIIVQANGTLPSRVTDNQSNVYSHTADEWITLTAAKTGPVSIDILFVNRIATTIRVYTDVQDEPISAPQPLAAGKFSSGDNRPTSPAVVAKSEGAEA